MSFQIVFFGCVDKQGRRHTYKGEIEQKPVKSATKLAKGDQKS